MSESKAPGTRKPYRISKPREKWTDAEHTRFVDAVNQYGRNWRKIVQKVGTRSVAQVRSHAQKYFLKLEKAGNTDEVPPARAKKPSAKPYPTKPPGDDSSAGGAPAATGPESDESGARGQLRRTARHSTRPHRQDFTFLEESPGPMEGLEGEADQGPSEEGNGSNHNGSGSNGQNNGITSQRQSSVLSCADLANGAAPDTLISNPNASGANLLSEGTVLPQELSDPTDASSNPDTFSNPVIEARGDSAGDAGQYEELYNLAGRLCGNQDSSNRHMVSQLGSFQREKLVHMLDHLKNDVKAGMSPPGSSPTPLHSTSRHIGLPQEYTPPGLSSHSHMPDATAGHLGSMSGHLGGSMHLESSGHSHGAGLDGGLGGNLQLESGLSGQGSFSSNFGSMDPGGGGLHGGGSPDDLGSDLLPLQPSSDMDNGCWKLGMSGDLTHLLPPSPPNYCYQAPSRADSRIDSKIFDY